MKTPEQNRTEVMNYLNESSKHFFQSEDGKSFQAIMKIDEQFVFILHICDVNFKNGERYDDIKENVYVLDIENHLQRFKTEGKTKLKQRFHPSYDPYWQNSEFGMGPGKKPRSVKHYKELVAKVEKIVEDFKNKQ
jgi:hypothetical protein